MTSYHARAVDDHDVCKEFGQYVKFQVARQESEPAAVCNSSKHEYYCVV